MTNGLDISSPQSILNPGGGKKPKEINIIHNFSMSIIFLQHAPGATFEIPTYHHEKASHFFSRKGGPPRWAGRSANEELGTLGTMAPTIFFMNLDNGERCLFYFGCG
jgi:hypothetical protein